MAATVCVVGAGVTGCAAARELAALPGVDVRVVDRGGVAGGTTARAAGLASLAPTYADAPAVAHHATEFFRAYDGTRDFAYRERPGLGLVAEGGGGAARRRVERLRERGVDAAYLDPDAVRERFSRVRTGPIDGGVRHESVGTLDPRALASSLAADAEARGATFHTETAVSRLDVEDGVVRGVRTGTDDNPLRADAVVVAAGWRTEPLLRDAATLPIRPYRAQCAVVDPPDPVGEAFPVGWIPDQEVYFRPWDDGRLLVGGGATAVDDPAGASREADPAFRDRALTVLSEFFEGFGADDARVAAGWAGVDCGTPDARPVVDAPSHAPDGLVVAAGFHGKGVMTAPATAALVRGLVVEEVRENGADVSGTDAVGADAPDLPRGAFSLDRFDSRSPDFRFVSIEEADGAS